MGKNNRSKMESAEAAMKLMARLRSYSVDESCHSHIVDTMKFLPRCVKCLNGQTRDTELVTDCVVLIKNLVLNPEFASAVAFEPRMAHELYRIRSNLDMSKATRHHATYALREIKTGPPRALVEEHLQWLLDEDLEDSFNKTTEAAAETTPSKVTQAKEKEWFMVEIPELSHENSTLELRIQKECKGILSMRRGDPIKAPNTLIITCLSSYSKDVVLKNCSDVLFKARTLSRRRSASLEQPFEPDSPEEETTMETRDDSDKSPGSPPPAYGAAYGASPCFKSPVKRSGKKPPMMSTPGTPLTPGRAAREGRREVRGGLNRKRDSFHVVPASSAQSCKAQYLDMEKMLAGDYNLTLSGHDASLAARKHRKKIIQEEKVKNETSLVRRLSSYTSRSLSWVFGGSATA